MAFWDKRKKESLTDGRKFKQADLSGFVPPIFVTEREINPSDEKLIEHLKASFEDSGVIKVEDDYEEYREQSLDEIAEFAREANANASSEKDFHPDKQFDEKLHEELDNYEHNAYEDGGNFLLDGMDDYGNEIYEKSDGFNSVWE